MHPGLLYTSLSRRSAQRAQFKLHMVFVYSPHREGGGTLHVPSPSNSPRSNPNSALDQLRRSLSRSPSKGPAFRLVTSKSNSPSPNSPLSPSPLTPSRRSCLHGTDSTKSPQEPKPLASPFVPNSRKKQRPNIRHLSPMRPSARPLGIQRSPARRALADSSDHGNATPVSSASSSEGVENEDQVQQAYSDKMDISVSTNPYTTQETGNLLAPHHALGRKDRPSGYFDIVKSSPLKRSEGSTNLDLAYLGTPAKRRSLHGAFFGPDFNIFDHAASLEKNDSSTQDNEATGLNNFGQDSPSASTPLSHRSSSLRKTTLQQRFEKPSVGRARLNAENFFESRTPHAPDTKARDRLSLDFSVPQLSRESPFSNDNLPNASIHPAAPMRREVSGPGALPVSSRHPLARTISQSSSNSSIAVDSPTHIPVRNPGGRRPKGDLSRSLPFGAFRPTIQDAQATASSSETSSFTTPNNYKLAKPLPAAFMSTGLISKRNKNIEHESLDLGDSLGNMPDTPCKRPTSLTSISPQPTPDINLHKTRQARHTMHSFGTPSTPFNPNVSRAAISNTKGFSIFGSGFNGEASRRGSFAASDAEDGPKSPLATVQREQSRSFEIPPTPTKQALDSQYFPFDAKFPSPDASRFARSVYKNESAIGSPESAINCKSILISTPSVVRGGENNGDPESSPSNMLRFRSLNSIPSFSKRLQAGNRSHCPTPLTKTSLSLPIISKQNQVTKQSSLPTASPIFDRHGGKSPHTPLDTIAPPDPSGLSISAQAEKSAFSRFPPTNPGSSSGVPATPTAPRDSFGRSSKFSSSLTPMHHAAPADVDTGITSRFDKVEPLTTGEFSQVFRVSCAAEPTIQQFSFNSSFSTQTLKGSPSEQVWAVKKASRAFIGPRDRQRKLQEVEILKSLGRADHTVNYVDSWEYNHHLYIQTEFCEEGTLDLFLEKAGRKARLDDFRIWKIMLELSLVRMSTIIIFCS